jgi:hypothetical protein
VQTIDNTFLLYNSFSMNKNIIFGVVAAIIILAALVAFASNRPPVTQEKMDNKATDSAMLPDNKMTKPEVKFPSVLPTDLPLFPNAKLVDSTEITSEKSYALSYEIDASKATPKQVLDYYVTEFPKQGYKSDQPIINESAGNYIISGKKGSLEFRVMNYLSASDNTKTSININVSGYSKK